MVEHADLDARSALVPADGLPPGHFNDLPIKTISAGVDANYAAAYAAADLRPTASTTITGGVRVDYFSHIRAAVPEPRVEIAQRAGQMTLHAAAGRYARDPSQLEGIPTNLAPEQATQLSGGTDVDLGQGLVATASVYHTTRSSLAVEDPTQMTAPDVLPYASTGSGTSAGVDLMVRYHADHVFGWLAYSFGKSERRETAAQALHATPFDQTHTLTAVGSYTAGAWSVGARFQYASGLPYTDIVGGTLDSQVGRYLPILGTPYGARYPNVTELDLRIEHVWTTKHVKLAGFIDVMNVFRDARIERYTYNPDFSSRTPLTQYVPLPSIGIRGEI
jgi:outer membrane receptor protein involved in Fe transport